MKVLMINGSPRAKGCTYTALVEAAGALREEGIDSEILHIGREPIRGCTACGRCFTLNNACSYEDGLVNKALALMKECDGLIVGSPVYYASPNGALLSFLDRMFFAGECFQYKPAAAIVSARRAGTTAALDVLNKYFAITGMPQVPSQYWNMIHGNTPEEARRDAEGMQIMRALGHNMAWLLKCISAGAQAGIVPAPTEKRVWTNFIRE
jgi:multimeric flavodoxin WrbA